MWVAAGNVRLPLLSLGFIYSGVVLVNYATRPVRDGRVDITSDGDINGFHKFIIIICFRVYHWTLSSTKNPANYLKRI